MEEVLRKLETYEKAVANYWHTKEPSDPLHFEMKKRRAELVTAIEDAITRPAPSPDA